MGGSDSRLEERSLASALGSETASTLSGAGAATTSGIRGGVTGAAVVSAEATWPLLAVVPASDLDFFSFPDDF
jgi:hypothetical protein